MYTKWKIPILNAICSLFMWLLEKETENEYVAPFRLCAILGCKHLAFLLFKVHRLGSIVRCIQLFCGLFSNDIMATNVNIVLQFVQIQSTECTFYTYGVVSSFAIFVA